jgi:hypothetical protein
MRARSLIAVLSVAAVAFVGGWGGKAYSQSEKDRLVVAQGDIQWPPWFDPAKFGPCQWRGKAPICKGNCEPGETQITTHKSAGGNRCATGAKVYCCQPKQ